MLGRQSGQQNNSLKITKKKIGIGFIDFYIHGNLWFIPFGSMNQKLLGVLVVDSLQLVMKSLF